MLPQENKKYLAVGLMSGTSLDGVDAALIRTDGERVVEDIDGCYVPYPRNFQKQLQEMAQSDIPLDDILRLERRLTDYHAEAIKKLLEQPAAQKAGNADIVGFHGQTIRHIPGEELTWQIGDASYLAEKSGLPVVADFRRRDMAAGGEGAPLAPLFHMAKFSHVEGPHAVLNIGGVSNLTFIGTDGTVTAGDVGPGCGLVDKWVQQHINTSFDKDGKLAVQGTVNALWLENAIEKEPFFKASFPKSADRYQFDHLLPNNLSAADGAATLCELTALTVGKSFEKLCPKEQQPTLWVAGGGVENPVLMAALKKYAKEVKKISDLGIEASLFEAACFAWLAVRRLRGLPTSLPETTGAKHGTTGGVLTA